MEESKKQITSYIEKIAIFILCLFTLIFPLLFLSTTTDAFTLPKQILLIGTTILTILLFCIKSIIEGKVKFRTTPFDLSLAIFLLVIFASAIFSVNRYDALTNFVPLLFIIILFFLINNLIRTEKALLFFISSLTGGAVISGLFTILTYLKIYVLPFAYTKNQFFNTYGSLLDEILYLTLILPLTGYFAYGLVSKFKNKRKGLFQKMQEEKEENLTAFTIAFSTAFIILALTIGVIAFIFFTGQKPIILPFETGFQTAFASISQDTGRIFKSFLLGSGYGTYLTDFTRFKVPTYNQDPNLWTFTFFRSSSFILELLSTTGFLGILSFLFILYKIIKERNFFLPLIFAIIAAFILPFSFNLITLFFILVSIFAVIRSHEQPSRYSDTELYVVALKKGLFAARTDHETIHQNSSERKYSKILPIIFSLILIGIISIPTYLSIKFFVSDLIFQKSLIAASQNQGLETYNKQIQAIQIFKYRDVYYRSFAQTNLALANALANSTKGTKPSAQVQNNILLLIQQAINAGKSATSAAPQTAFNWNALAEIYRSLIGFGENADKFAIQTAQQAVALDQSNPQQYIEIGGIYYQLGMYDQAINEFQKAIILKKDYANAYYNLGHALESKNDLQDALTMYQTVKELVKNDPTNLQKISVEIKTLEQKIGQQKQTNTQPAVESKPEEKQQSLDVNKPQTQLPERKPQVKIPAPTISPIQTKPSSKTSNPTTTTPTPQP